MLDRAYALLTIKALDGERRTISGLASTPTPDRGGDIIEPLGATFCNPLPLLLHHDRERPVGRVTLKATAQGIEFDAFLPEIADAGAVRDRVNEAWHSIKAGLITGVSIGFRPLAHGIKELASGGLHFLKTEICELSLVTVPANVETTIQTIKSVRPDDRVWPHPARRLGPASETSHETHRRRTDPEPREHPRRHRRAHDRHPRSLRR